MALNLAVANPEALRNFREFLETYNHISETCFKRCVVNLNSSGLSKEEENCCDRCTEKNVRINHKVLGAFMVEQPKITEERLKRAESEAQEAMKKLESQGKSAEVVSPEEMAQRMMSAGMQSNSVPNLSSSKQ